MFGDAKWHRERVADLVLAGAAAPAARLSARRVSALDRISVAAIGTSVADLEAETKRAEAAGVECVWAPELFRTSVTQAAYLAGKTERIDVATGIVWAFTRSPFILAVSALDIDEMSGGRFRLGLGSGVKRLNETWHNAEYGKPAPHLREAIEATRLIMHQASAGEPIRYEGDYYDIDIKGWIRPHPAPRESVPIYTAGVQAGMCRMAGDVADGLIGHPIQSLRWIDEVVVSAFEEGLRRSGRERSRLRLPADRLLRDRRRRGAGDRDGPPHDLLLRDGEDLHAALGAARLRRQRGRRRRRLPPRRPRRVPAAISDEMVETYCAAGPLDKVRARVEATAERADGLFLTPPTYFISPEELSEYQNRIIDAFGPERLTERRPDTRAEVLERVRAIPQGFVATYGDVSPGAPRFAGTVLFEGHEPDLPWWRVVRADGSLAKGARQRRLLCRGRPVPRRPGRHGRRPNTGLNRLRV